jgi:excisionase family DNA binding protein
MSENDRTRPGSALDELEPLLTEREVADTLGISERTVRRYRESGKLPYVKPEFRVLYRPQDILASIQERYHPVKK